MQIVVDYVLYTGNDVVRRMPKDMMLGASWRGESSANYLISLWNLIPWVQHTTYIHVGNMYIFWTKHSLTAEAHLLCKVVMILVRNTKNRKT
jgi:hypothetical protein